MRVGLFFGSFDPPHIGHVSDVEKDLAGPAYPRGIPTYVVLEELKSRMPEDELVIITTPETYKDIPEWHKGSVILCDYKFLMVVSGEETPQDLPENVHVVYVPQITICSTCIRNRVKLGVYIQPFVKDTVEAFIDPYTIDDCPIVHYVGGFETDRDRDSAMTNVSSEDIAFIRSKSKWDSGTAENILRRRTMKYLNPSFYGQQ